MTKGPPPPLGGDPLKGRRMSVRHLRRREVSRPVAPTRAIAPGAGITVNEAVLVAVVRDDCEVLPFQELKLNRDANSAV